MLGLPLLTGVSLPWFVKLTWPLVIRSRRRFNVYFWRLNSISNSKWVRRRTKITTLLPLDGCGSDGQCRVGEEMRCDASQATVVADLIRLPQLRSWRRLVRPARHGNQRDT
ncbi:hypothetical protein GW17_00021032 [Ensete ventricosum]|nr:hypothetical protein GW17_00021032 [Ensete ventricosum]